MKQEHRRMLLYHVVVFVLLAVGMYALFSCGQREPTAPEPPVEYAVQYQVSGVPEEVITICYTAEDGLVQLMHPFLPWNASATIEGAVLVKLIVSNGVNPGEFGAGIMVDGVSVASGMAAGYLHIEYQLP